VGLLIGGSMVVSLVWPPETDPHQEVLDNTEAASLVADVPHIPMRGTAADESSIGQVPRETADSSGEHPPD
jgi:hypothetical protein